MLNSEKFNYNPQETSPQREELSESFNVQFKSIASEKHPDRNEDTILIMKDKKVFGVFDGLGGSAAGEVASREVRNYIAEVLEQSLIEKFSLEQIQIELKKTLYEANERLLQLVKKNPKLEGMGTTASVVKIWEDLRDERKAIIANVGDSRVYVRRTNGQLEQITVDDDTIGERVKNEEQARIIRNKLNNVVDLNTLTGLEHTLFNYRNILSQVLGMHRIEPRIHIVDIGEGEKLIITSDGIHDNLTDKEIAQILNTAQDNQAAIENLINASRNRSRERQPKHPRAKADDMSAIVVEILRR